MSAVLPVLECTWKHTGWYKAFVRTDVINHQNLTHDDPVCYERLVGEIQKEFPCQWARDVLMSSGLMNNCLG